MKAGEVGQKYSDFRHIDHFQKDRWSDTWPTFERFSKRDLSIS